MKVAQYTFQSPSTSRVQIGRLDPSTKEKTIQSDNSKSTNDTNKAQLNTENLKPIKTNEIKSVDFSNQLLDVYA